MPTKPQNRSYNNLKMDELEELGLAILEKADECANCKGLSLVGIPSPHTPICSENCYLTIWQKTQRTNSTGNFDSLKIIHKNGKTFEFKAVKSWFKENFLYIEDLTTGFKSRWETHDISDIKPGARLVKE